MNTPTPDILARDFSSVSPSAKQLLLLKGFTNIPFAKEAAQLMLSPKKYIADLDKMDFAFKARLMHFESRYRSIDDLLAGLRIQNILELSSGFSFRGLDLIHHQPVNYIDTDLPEVVETKRNFVDGLKPAGGSTVGNLQTMPLNALDEKQFQEIAKLFPAGELAIINEGLLMYLNVEEKKKLFHNIRGVLKERGGYWITADIYVRKDIDLRNVMVNEALQGFYDAHNIEGNKFESFEAAEKLFNEAGLVIDKTSGHDYSNVSDPERYLGNATQDQLGIIQNASKIRATWRLKVAS